MSTRSQYIEEVYSFVIDLLGERQVPLTRDEASKLQVMIAHGVGKAEKEAPDDWQIRYEDSILTMVDRIVGRPVTEREVHDDYYARRDRSSLRGP